jgi:hypothetical protein
MATIATFNANNLYLRYRFGADSSRRLVGVGAALIALAFAVAIPAGAQESPRPLVTFSQETVLAIKWDDLDGDGVSVDVFNNATDRRTLTFRLTAFRNEATGTRLTANQVAGVAPATAAIDAGDSVEVRITRAADAPDLAVGSHTSSLVALTERGAEFGRLKIVLTRAEATVSAGLAPLADEVTVRVYRNRYLLDELDGLLGRWLGDDWFSKRYPAPADVRLPLKTKEANLAIPAKAEQRELGALKGSNGVVAVSYADAAEQLPSGRQALVVAFDGLDRLGEYSGKLDTVPADKEAGDVTLKLVYSDFVWWPLLAVALGVLTGLVISRLIGVGIPSNRLRDEVQAMRTAYDGALAQFRRGTRRAAWRRSNITKPVKATLTACEDEIRLLGRTQIAAIPEEEIKAVRAKLTPVRSAVDDFLAYAGEMEALEEQVREMDRTQRLVGVGGPRRPKAATKLREELLTAVSFDSFAALTARRERVRKAAENAVAWEAHARSLKEAIRDLGGAAGQARRAARCRLRPLRDALERR